jgi:hypothetical protein
LDQNSLAISANNLIIIMTCRFKNQQADALLSSSGGGANANLRLRLASGVFNIVGGGARAGWYCFFLVPTSNWSGVAMGVRQISVWLKSSRETKNSVHDQ